MKLAYPAFAVAKANAKGKCCERRRRSRAQCLSACTGVVDFFDNNGFIKNRVLQCFIKATTSKSRQNKTCIIHRIRKRKTTAFQPSSKFIVFKKDTVGNGFLFIANSNRVELY